MTPGRPQNAFSAPHKQPRPTTRVRARAMRNRIVHDYGHVDIEVLEGVVIDDLPVIIAEIDRLLAS